MSQNFNKLLGSSIIKNDRATINENFDAIRSAHSGTAFPTQELIAGMEFFNTSTKKLYRLQPDLSTWVLELDLSSGTAVVAKASSADAAGKASKDANGKDISTYIAKLESDVNNAFVINFYDGNNNKLGSVTIPETKVETMTGASSSSAGKAGLVPQPKAGDNDKFLCGDGSFKEAGKVKSVNGKTGDVVVGEIVDANINGKEITLTFADNATKTLTTQDTTYEAMTADEATAGTATIARTITAKVLHDKIASSGKLTQKFTKTNSYFADGLIETITVTGLTPNNLVFVVFSGRNNSVNATINSGVWETASLSSSSATKTYLGMTNGTSMSIKMSNSGNSSYTITVYH